MPIEIDLIETQVEVEDRNDPVLFNHLTVVQRLADANTFSYRWRLPEAEVSLETMLGFYKDHLGKQVTLQLGQFSFKGIISSINCVNQDSAGAEFEVVGQGLFVKHDQVAQCRSFYKKKFKQIVETLNTHSETKLKVDPINDDELFYTVQYNQTTLAFYKMLAARQGEWMFYNGQEMIIGSPLSDSVTLKNRETVFNISINAAVAHTNINTIGFDHFKGESVSNQASAMSGSGFLEAGLSAGDKVYGTDQKPAFVNNVPNQANLEKYNQLKQKARASNSVQIKGTTFDSTLKLGGKVKILKENGDELGEFIIIELVHHSVNQSEYKNQFTAIPADIEVPPYTNPDIFPPCHAQHAIVVDNVDKDGLDRIRVRFPWQGESDHTPWLSFTTPHAGKDKGFRFLPEIDDEVLVGFIGDHAEKPVVLGAVYTDKNKSGEDHEDNSVKIIGSRTGRRLEIRDKQEVMAVQDFDSKKTLSGNALVFWNKESKPKLYLSSQQDDDNQAGLFLEKGETGKYYIKKGGTEILMIEMDGNGKKITIKSAGDIEIKADKDIKMEATNITLKAKSNININGQSGVEITGTQVKAKAEMALEMQGLTAKVKADTQLELSGSAMATLKGGIVQIN
ncbi:MAG: hypothetical protein IPN26_01735 [Bacteroidetes bacterium]|nr:hypothetical protein [Bacteroidota bacterium]